MAQPAGARRHGSDERAPVGRPDRPAADAARRRRRGADAPGCAAGTPPPAVADAVGADATVFVDDRVATFGTDERAATVLDAAEAATLLDPNARGPPGARPAPTTATLRVAGSRPASRSRRRDRAGGSPAQRPLRPRGGGRPGRHGHGPRRPRRRAAPPGGAQGAVARGRPRPVGPLALRARGAGDRAARSSAHRPGLRPRGRVGRTAGLRDEAGRGPDVRPADRRHARVLREERQRPTRTMPCRRASSTSSRSATPSPTRTSAASSIATSSPRT